jgi:hypothetical protein
MTSHLSFAVAQARQQDMLRHAQEARLAAAVMAETRRSRVRLTLPRVRLAGRPAPAQTTTVNA